MPKLKKPHNTNPPRPRDRAETRERIVEAATRLIAHGGFQTLGVNAVAKEAGVDKVLIYRYFGDLPGLIEEIGSRMELWLGDTHNAPAADSTTYGKFARAVLLRYLAELRGNVLLQRLLAWELVEDDELIRRLGAARSAAVGAWFAKLGANATPPPADVDAGAVNAILIAAAHHLALRESTAGEFAGLNLSTPKTWGRIQSTLALILERMYGDGRDHAITPSPSDEPANDRPRAGGRARPKR